MCTNCHQNSFTHHCIYCKVNFPLFRFIVNMPAIISPWCSMVCKRKCCFASQCYVSFKKKLFCNKISKCVNCFHTFSVICYADSFNHDHVIHLLMVYKLLYNASFLYKINFMFLLKGKQTFFLLPLGGVIFLLLLLFFFKPYLPSCAVQKNLTWT